MKICAYCDNAAEDSVKECPHCGASEFYPACPNCGKGVPQGDICPNCGESLRARRAEKSYTYTPAPAAPVNSGTYTAAPSAAPVKEKKKIGCGTVLLWIFFFPIMAAIAIWKSNMKLWVKILLTVLLLAFCFGGRSAAGSASSSSEIDTGALEDSLGTISASLYRKANPTPAPAPVPEACYFSI